jgi:transcription elongation factor Elf1
MDTNLVFDCPVCGAKESLRADVKHWVTVCVALAAPDDLSHEPEYTFYAEEDEYLNEVSQIFCSQCGREWAPTQFVEETWGKEASA